MRKTLWMTLAALLCVGTAGAQVHVDSARIGCLDIQKDPNLTGMVGNACNGKMTCSYKAPTPQQYQAAGVVAKSRTFCTEGMEITYHCAPSGPSKFVNVPGDAWNHDPAALACDPPPPPPGSVHDPITVTKARIGCLDIQKDSNLIRLVTAACNGRASCSYKAPTPQQYQAAGVTAAGRTFCTQGMEIGYRCGQNDEQLVEVPGDAWNHDAASLVCNGSTIATNHQFVTLPQEPPRAQPLLGPPAYYIAPRDMLDWTPTQSHGDYTFQGFRPPQPATPAMYNSTPAGRAGAPVSTLGANEGRVRAELRAAAAKKDPVHDLCQAAQSFTRNRPASGDTPSDHDFGNAYADLSVTGKAVFAQFARLNLNDVSLRANPACAGASPQAITEALDRAYRVANALRGPHDSPERRALGWIAVSGEDDQPYRPVNVPTNSGKFPELQIQVHVPKYNITVNTRYMIAHAHAPAFPKPNTFLVNGGPGRQVPSDPLPTLANDAQVILFTHGMDSRLEEADDLTAALHRLGGHNWTIISMDLPTSGYADNLDYEAYWPVSTVACHNTPVVDFNEEFVVAFVDALDAQLHGQLKPRVAAHVGGSLSGNLAMRLGRRPNTPWLTAVVPWSPAAIWPSMIAQRNAVAAGCDTGWDMGKDRGVNQALKWAGLEDRFKASHETPELRRELFYGGFDWDGGDLVAIFSSENHQPQASCWFSDSYACKKNSILAARLDRQETYDAKFRSGHWRLGAEQLAFSQQQFAPGTREPLYLLNNKRMLLLSGVLDVCGDLGKYTRDVAAKMVNTPGYARFLQNTGHSLDNEHPDYVAKQIADFLSGAGTHTAQK